MDERVRSVSERKEIRELPQVSACSLLCLGSQGVVESTWKMAISFPISAWTTPHQGASSDSRPDWPLHLMRSASPLNLTFLTQIVLVIFCSAPASPFWLWTPGGQRGCLICSPLVSLGNLLIAENRRPNPTWINLDIFLFFLPKFRAGFGKTWIQGLWVHIWSLNHSILLHFPPWDGFICKFLMMPRRLSQLRPRMFSGSKHPLLVTKAVFSGLTLIGLAWVICSSVNQSL